MKNVALHNLGCKVNAYEMDVMQQKLQEMGYGIVSFDEVADIYIINTCTVTNIADRKSRQMLHKVKKRNPKAVVVAVGCYVETGTEQVVTDEAIDIAIGNNKKGEIVSILEEYFASHQEKQITSSENNVSEEKEAHRVRLVMTDINHTKEYEDMTLVQTAEHTRAYIKVQDGCNQFCSYCVIPFARGRVRSRRKEEVIREVEGLVENGYQEIVVTGIHLSSYGVDFENKVYQGESMLLELLQSIHEIEGIKRIRLGSLEPRIITEEFAKALASMKKICPHFHLSLQSGCDETLLRMNRRYRTGEYYEKVELLRKYYEHPAITTDVIVGFPGETEEEFQMSRDFLEKVRFFEMHVFKYSKRKGTRAAVMDNQVTDEKKSLRSDILLEMEREHSKEYRSFYIGKKLQVLFEEEKQIGEEKYMVGHTEQYVKVAVRSTGEDWSNQLRDVVADDFLNDEILIAH